MPHNASQKTQMIREVVAVFQDEATLDAAIDELEERGFNRAEISLMASETAVEQKLGDRYQRMSDAADDPRTPRVPAITPEEIGSGEGALIGGLVYVGAMAMTGAVVASGGALLPAALAALAGGAGGGALGGWLAKRLGDRHAREVQEHIAHGGLVIWVSLRDPAHETLAIEILSRHAGEAVRAHEIAVFDPAALPETPPSYPVGLPYLFRRAN